MANQPLERFKFPGVPDTFIIPKSIISSEIEVASDNYSTIITNLDDQPVNTIYSYAENLQSKVSNLPSNKAMTIMNFAQKSTGGLGQVMLAVERNGSDDYLYFRTIGGSPAVWSSWVKVANNNDLKADLNVLNSGAIDLFKGGFCTFYNGYYSGTTYNGNGQEATPPFGAWVVLLIPCVAGEEIVISGMPTTVGAACVWLNSNTLTDVESTAWNSNASNGTHRCKTNWLALTGYKTDPNSVSVVWNLRENTQNQITKIDTEFTSFADDSFTYITQYLDVNKKTSGKIYYSNSTTIGNSSGRCIFPAINLKANKTYTLENVRPIFTNYKVGGTATTIDPNDNGAVNKTVTFTPSSDCELYVTGGDSANVMVFDAEYSQNDYVYGKLRYEIKSNAIGNNITENNCTFFKKCEQLLKSADAISGKFWNISSGSAAKSSATGIYAYEPFKLIKDETYRFIDVYGYFSLIADADGSNAIRLTDSIANHWSGEYTPSADCYIFMSVHNDFYESTAMVLNDTKYLPEEYVEGVYYTYLTT